jgi:hypothetical protein
MPPILFGQQGRSHENTNSQQVSLSLMTLYVRLLWTASQRGLWATSQRSLAVQVQRPPDRAALERTRRHLPVAAP